MDGHTEAGSQPIDLDAIFTIDEVEQLIRAIETAVMASGSGLDDKGRPQAPMELIARQEFLKSIVERLRQALDSQRP